MQCPVRVLATVALAGALLFVSCCGSNNPVANSVSPAPQTYAYVGVGGAGTVDQFEVANDGTLTPLSPSTVPSSAGNGPGSIMADPSGKYLFTAGYVDPPMISQFVISPKAPSHQTL